eukprot:m.144929 g.144929  ORF g.144929 m.144929 type:complete len:129 (+) comp23051_c0_seq10:362-748(+)
MADGRVFGIGIGIVFLGLLYLFSLVLCGMFSNSVRAKRVYFLTMFTCSAFTIFLISIPREGDQEEEAATENVDKTFVLREFMLFFMSVFFAWALLLIPCFHWKQRIVVSKRSGPNPSSPLPTRIHQYG